MFSKKKPVEGQEETEVEQAEQKVKKEEKPRYEIVEVTATTELAILDNKTKETMNLLQAIVELRNDVDEMKKYLTS